ncbi:hypothetical protein RHS01_05231 [Rhizoctonia solani]|uniref:Uncharacterized protein n=1 Tax=Rhizoctonia solani TaxID=456999 RepID=A0A8H7M753_9AGAM|nr:hypothetical protein RHS01_05231 [Rhizoctonia solani]
MLTYPQLQSAATSSPTTTVKRRAESPAARPSPKRSRSEETADDSFLALLLPDSMSRFQPPSQDHWHRDDERVTLPPIAEDRLSSLPAQYTHRRPPVHHRTFSSPALQAHNVNGLRGSNAIGLHDDALAFSPVPPGAIDWLGAGRQVTRDDSSLSDFDPSAFGLESGASTPAFAFGPGPSPFSGFSPQFHPRSQAPINIAQALASSAGPSPMNSPAPNIPIDPSLTVPSPPSSRDQLENELSSVRAKIRELEFMNDLLQLRVVELESEKNKDSTIMSNLTTLSRLISNAAGMPEPRPASSDSALLTAPAMLSVHGMIAAASVALSRPVWPLLATSTADAHTKRPSLKSPLPAWRRLLSPGRERPYALRNPLLKLLQWRFGYKDGDFERDPKSGVWVEGEGEHAWETGLMPLPLPPLDDASVAITTPPTQAPAASERARSFAVRTSLCTSLASFS